MPTLPKHLINVHNRIPRNINNDIVPALDPEHAPQVELTAPARDARSQPLRPIAARDRGHVKLSQLYNSFLVPGEPWEIGDFFFTGVFFTNALPGGITQTPLTLPASPNFKLNHFPLGTLLYLGIKSVSIAPQSTPGTVGALQLLYVDPNGFQVDCGCYLSNASTGLVKVRSFSRVPVTDTDNPNLGMLQANLSSGASSVNYTYSVTLAAGYLLPRSESGVNECEGCK